MDPVVRPVESMSCSSAHEFEQFCHNHPKNQEFLASGVSKCTEQLLCMIFRSGFLFSEWPVVDRKSDRSRADLKVMQCVSAASRQNRLSADAGTFRRTPVRCLSLGDGNRSEPNSR
ncbi:unnamed protein product [Nippostrongylus brasiliensis]|uniref:Uncharacterized protein n=1 Tax=Nippostrongylus brasiliensis TaxID=27835 RepID=A0A0N4YMR4_NIPBR|nr:unnamed protein product [Nippostrongylus brasiliensis]